MALLLIIKRVVTLFIIEVNDFIKRHVSYLEANCEHKKELMRNIRSSARDRSGLRITSKKIMIKQPS